MPNFLQDVNYGTPEVLTQEIDFSQAFTQEFPTTLPTAGGPAFGGVGSGIGVGGGSKPQALHTEKGLGGEAEYAGGKPYAAATDVVFYLQRADATSQMEEGEGVGAGTAGSLTNSGTAADAGIFGSGFSLGDGVQQLAKVPADVSTGLSLDLGIQNPLSQLATGFQVGDIMSKSGGPLSGAGGLAGLAGKAGRTDGLFGNAQKALAGALTGLDIAQEFVPGLRSQQMLQVQSVGQSLSNGLRRVSGFSDMALGNQPVRGYSTGHGFFKATLDQSFDPLRTVRDVVATSADIMKTLDRSPNSEHAALLSAVSGGVSSGLDLIESINMGELGFTSQSSKAEADRVGPQSFINRRQGR